MTDSCSITAALDRLARLGPGPVLLRAAAVLDDRHFGVEPVCEMLLDMGRPAPQDALGIHDARARVGLAVLAIGPEARSAASGLDPERVVELPGAVLLPAMANAHTHLDLTAVGPRPHVPARGFDDWIALVMRERPMDEPDIRASVARGVRMCLQGGVVAVGDIAGATAGTPNPAAVGALLDSPLAGVSFLEVLGIGRSEPQRRRSLRSPAITDLLHRGAHGPMRVGLQPHAPYSTSRVIYDDCRQIADAIHPPAPLATHLAETLAEREFVAHARGPKRDLLTRLGLLQDADPMPAGIGFGEHSVGLLAQVLQGRPWLLAHMNDAPEDAIRGLRAMASTPGHRSIVGHGPCVAWCPRGWSYFGHEPDLGPHRWLDLLDVGIPVCFATDSIINLPDADVTVRGLCVLDEARAAANRLHPAHRLNHDPSMLLAMLTTVPARALGLAESAFRFTPSEPLAGVVAVQLGVVNTSASTSARDWWMRVVDGSEPRIAPVPTLLAFDRNAATTPLPTD